MIRTAECVSKGHPDKVADQISDAILDAYLTVDPNAHVAVETLCTTNTVVLAGEVSSKEEISKEDIKGIVRKVIDRVGYVDKFNKGFNSRTVAIHNHIHTQSSDLQANQSNGTVAGDQGIMFGYACNEASNYMPLELFLARRVIQIVENFKEFNPNILGPDCKSQVSVQFPEDGGKPFITSILISTQHVRDISVEDVRSLLLQPIWDSIKILDKDLVDVSLLPKIQINPAGRFVEGGPSADTGLTGRKIVVDQYGGRCPVGGGAFSGKDPSKVDRSAAYYARYVAKNIVASGICKECFVSLSYTIGEEYPDSITFDFKGTLRSDLSYDKVVIYLNTLFGKVTVKDIISKFNLKSPIYQKTASRGHFGIGDNPWEILDAFKDIEKTFNVK